MSSTYRPCPSRNLRSSTLRTACPMPNLAMVASPSVPDGDGFGADVSGDARLMPALASQTVPCHAFWLTLIQGLPLIPAQAGIREKLARIGLWLWVPAFAGTNGEGSRFID